MPSSTSIGLLQSIIDKLDRGDAPDAKFPSAKGEYWALCPFHADTHATNFSVSERGFKCHACEAKGGLKALAEKLGVAVLQCFSEGQAIHLYLKDYAEAKALDVAFLESVGVSERKYFSKRTAVRIAYLDEMSMEVAVRWRLAMAGDDRFRWNKGSKVLPYGLWRLGLAKEAGYVFIVEGESDAQTLWSHDVPALGIPGASTWRAEWSERLPEGIDVYIWQEPDQGGETLISKVAATLPNAMIVYPPVGRKDISECHILGDDVPETVATLRRQAVPVAEILAKAQNKEAARLHKESRRLLSCPSILDDFAVLCKRMGLVGEERNAKLLYLSLTSRVLAKPVSVAVKGPSSGGKSFTVETVLKTMPDSAYIDFTSMSDHALVYDDRPIDHRFIVLYEASGLGREKPGEVNTLAYMLRSLLSEGVIKYTTVEKTEEGLQPRVIERDGPTGLIVTTTWASLHSENETRMLSLTVKDDSEQTKGVFRALAERANGQGPSEPDLSEWHAFQHWLEVGGDKAVTIPFAHEMAELADASAVRLRRDFGKVISLLQSHAILHQASRGRDAQGRIVATMDDYRAVYPLVADLLNEGAQASVSATVRETVEAVAGALGNGKDSMSITDLAKALSLDKSSASRRQAVARELGYLVNQEDKRGRPARLVLGEAMPDEKPVLPTPEELESGKSVAGTVDRETYITKDKDATEGDKSVLLDPLENTATLQHSAGLDDADDVEDLYGEDDELPF